MKFKTSASLMIAIVLGLVTAYVGLDVVHKAKARAGTSAKIVVASRDMEPGYVIEASDLKLEDVPASLVPAKAFKDAKLVTGRTVLASVVRGYPLIDNQLAQAGAGSGMQAMVPKGMRAVAVEVSEGSAVAGLISPGCYVDVLATFNNGEQTIATTVVQNVKVQFVQRSKPPRSSNSNNNSGAAATGSPEQGAVKTVTLIVTPKQATRIELANNQGKPRLILRGGADDTDVADSTVKQNELLGIPDAPPPATQPAPVAVAPPPPPPPVVPPAVEASAAVDAFDDMDEPVIPNKRAVYILKGGNESTIYFDDEGERAMEEQAPPAPGRARRQQEPTTRPQQKKKVDGGAAPPQTASGASPGEPAAPRYESAQKNFRKGM